MSKKESKLDKIPDDSVTKPAPETCSSTDEAVSELQRYAQNILKMMRSGMKADLRDEP